MTGKYFKEVVPTVPSDLVSVEEAAEISGMTRPTN